MSDPVTERTAHDVESAVQRVANLVLNASALADRMEALPAVDPRAAGQRRAKVALLRAAARAGQEAIARATAHLVLDDQAGGERDIP